MIGSDSTRREAALAVRLLDSSPDGLFLVDADEVITVANRSAAPQSLTSHLALAEPNGTKLVWQVPVCRKATFEVRSPNRSS